MTDYSHLFDYERELHGHAARHDVARLKTLLSADFFEFGASGIVWRLADTLAKLPEEPTTGPEITSSNYAARELAAGVVLVTYQAFVPAHGVTSNRSSIWRLNGDQWQMEFHQGTKVPA